MEASKYGKLIRTGRDEILSCTITEVDREKKQLEFLYVNFREAVEKRCGILFFKYNGHFYYPLNMEFRLIDNNVLFLIKELGISKFSDLALLLESSFRREEGREVGFFAIVYELQTKPDYSIRIADIRFDKTDEVIWLADD